MIPADYSYASSGADNHYMTKILSGPASLPDGAGLYLIPLFSAGLMLLPETVSVMLYLQLADDEAFRYWQVLSSHFVHLSWQHWLGNAVGIAVLRLLYGQCFKSWYWLAVLLFLVVSVAAGLMLLSSRLAWYGGFSGVLVGLFCLAAITDRRYPVWFNSGVLALIGCYTLIGLMQGEVSEGLTGVPVANYSHVIGGIAGLISGCTLLALRAAIKASG